MTEEQGAGSSVTGQFFGNIPFAPPYLGIAIMEKDAFGSILWAWEYPAIDPELKAVLQKRADLQSNREKVSLPFSFGKYKDVWHYFHNTSGIETNKLPKVIDFSVVLLSKEFNPEKYEAFCALLASFYIKTGKPVNLLEGYLRVYTEGAFDAGELGSFDGNAFDVRRAWVASSIKDVIKLFGVEIIRLWAAMLLGKRVVVYCDDKALLLRVIRTLPLFVWHKKDWDMLRPFVTLTKPEIEDLAGMGGCYCAGFTNADVVNREQLYDVLLNVSERTVVVASHAKADFAMGGFVKDLAMFLVEGGDSPDMTDGALIKELIGKTADMLANVKAMGSENDDGSIKVTKEHLQSKNLAPNLERFLWNVAVAEGMT